jgi:ribonuclease P protein component
MAVSPKATKQSTRLLSSQQFREVYERGQKFNSPFFSAFILRTNTGEQRIGITVTRKLGGAVVRNRCKRRIRELFRRQAPLTLKDVGCDLVINAKASLSTADYKELEAAFERTFTRFRELCLK